MKSDLYRKALMAMVALSGLLVCTSHVSALDLFLDHRRFTDRDGNKYFVAFVARGGSATGHAFVVWGVENSKRRMSIQQAYGFYPSKGFGVFGPVPGAIRNEAFNPKSALITDRMIVQVNRDWFEASKSEIARWSTNQYQLFANNCIDFVRAVAQRTNSKLPARERTDTPSSHLQKIIKKNR